MRARASGAFAALGKRECQEDHVWKNPERGLYVVADGFGGPAAGTEAARVSCEEVRKFLIREAGDEEATFPYVMRSYYSLAGNVLFNSVVHANRKLMKANRDRSVHERGGASVLAAYFDESLLAVAQVGSCSAHLVRDAKVVELVSPKSLRRMIDPTYAGVATTSFYDAPLASLGTSQDLEPEIVEVKIRPWDALILSTDGFWESGEPHQAHLKNLVWFSELLQTAKKSDEVSADVLIQDLIGRAEGVSYRDNASFLVVIF